MVQTFTRVSQQAAGYKLMGGIERCGRCRFFLKNNLCARVIGDVSPSAWCRLFSREAVARMDAGGGAAATHGNVGAPTVDDDFSSVLPAGWSFIRAGTNATNCLYTDAATAPAFTTYAANAPRFLDFGLLMEPPRTNLFLNSEAPVTQNIAVVSGTTYTVWCLGTGNVALSGMGASGSVVAGTPVTFTANASGNVACTCTAPLTRVQFEAGPSPTSYIQSTATAQTRAEERLSKSYASFGPSYGTYWVKYIWNGGTQFPPGAVSPAMVMSAGTLSFTNSSDTDAIQISNSSGTNTVAGNTTNAAGSTISSAQLSVSRALGYLSRVALTVSPTRNQVAADGVLGTQATSNYRPAGFTGITLGSGPSTAPAFNGFIRGFKYWPVDMPDAQLVVCTTAGYFAGPPVFSLDLRTQLPRIMTFARAATTGIATDGYQSDAPGSTYNTFAGPPAARFSSRGLMMEAQRNNYFPAGNAPITRASLSLAANQGYRLWIVGTGSVTVSPGTTTPDTAGNGGVATQGNPLFIQCTVAGTVTLTVAGSVNRAQIEQVGGNTVSGACTSFIQNTTSLQGRGGENLNMPVGSWFNVNARTYYLEVYDNMMSPAGAYYSFGSADGSQREQLFSSNPVASNANGPFQWITENIFPVASDNTVVVAAPPAGQNNKVAVSTSLSKRTIAINGVIVGTGTVTGIAKPAAVLGVLNTALQSLTSGNGARVFRRFAFYDYDLTDAQLIALTT